MAAIATAALKNTSLKSLMLTRNDAGPKAGEIFAELIQRNRVLHSLDLSFNRFRTLLRPCLIGRNTNIVLCNALSQRPLCVIAWLRA